jgi:hypothetical protein
MSIVGTCSIDTPAASAATAYSDTPSSERAATINVLATCPSGT